jgi:hypothetical protein
MNAIFFMGSPPCRGPVSRRLKTRPRSFVFLQ